ncbi:sodium:proton antiporter [Nocardioides mesophilus]|uniref:Sodium:proton antiporter n=2 Tax=Nocardioides mesophilus TaxID=433659 RepID=A0A7G9RGU1_9ACTN|nr:sodium:proton antiporter [Nocardioides mesophilus]
MDSAARDNDSGHEDEDKTERLARNFNELLQELRVTQTGIQILTGFLLTVPFTQRFPDLDAEQKYGYLTVLCGAVLATGFIIAPVALHRTLFRQGEKEWLVHAANWCARAGLFVLALTMAGVVWLVFDVVISRAAAVVAGGLALAFFAALWWVLPLVKRADAD